MWQILKKYISFKIFLDFKAQTEKKQTKPTLDVSSAKK